MTLYCRTNGHTLIGPTRLADWAEFPIQQCRVCGHWIEQTEAQVTKNSPLRELYRQARKGAHL